MNGLVLIILIIPYVISFLLYRKGMEWYKNGIVLSVLFWISTGILGVLGDKFNTDISEIFFFYYFWMIWFFLGLLIISIGFWIYNIINSN